VGERSHHTLFDFGGRFVGKGDRKNTAWIDTVLAD
jgi:hypothetical protein